MQKSYHLEGVIKKGLLTIYQRLYDYYGPQNWWPADSPFEVIVGAILTQNTSWQNVEKAIKNLKNAGLLNPRSLYYIDINILSEYIRPSGYFNIKAKRLKEFLSFFFDRYSGSLEDMFKEDMLLLRKGLLDIKGIGPETADSILLYAGNYPIFVVDVYTHRVFSRHRFLLDTTTYEECQGLFMDNLPGDAGLFNEYHALIVRVGKEYCKKRDPLCSGCPLEDLLGD